MRINNFYFEDEHEEVENFKKNWDNYPHAKPLDQFELRFICQKMFPEVLRNEEHFNHITNFINQRLETNACCVLYAHTPGLKKFFEENFISIAKKEMIITRNHSFLYTDDYRMRPEKI